MIHLYVRLIDDTRIKHINCEEFYCFTDGSIDCRIDGEPEEIDNLCITYKDVKTEEDITIKGICDIEVY